MHFTFGIITDGKPIGRVGLAIESIHKQNIPLYEIIIVGGDGFTGVNHIPFDESIQPRWITRKKNLITANAKYENIVYMHDYVRLSDGWYEGFLKFGNDWDVCMTKIVDSKGCRFRDWCCYPDDISRIFKQRSHVLLPYDVYWMTNYMYISGAYWVAKKQLMESEPLDEALVWGQSEDVEWSRRIRNKYRYRMNHFSEVNLTKKKDRKFGCCTNEDLETIKQMRNVTNKP